ncbi:hypothetical protein [Pseudomonas syringae]|uniref:hypothetical protein n=1 Tax=Pseudomonas syringae TaxID=317 RepID=UPI000B2C86AC
MWVEGGIGRTTLHALMGGAVSSATGGDFTTGAVAAGASQAMAGALNDVFKASPEYRQAAAQIVGLAAAGLAGGDVEKAAWVSAMADQYNRQLHPNEIPLLEKQSASLAQEANISPAEAEKRLAQALAYYTDKNWNGALAENGVVPDAVTLKHLGIALSPLADTYAAVGDVPVAAGSKSYTPAETVALITDYRNTHTAEYADASINAVNMQGLYAGDPGYKYANFYQKNLAVNTDFLSSLSGTLAGIAQGSGSALSDSFGSAWALMSDPAGVSEQAANGLMGLSKNPWGSFMNSVEASQTKEAMATIYDMQGNTAASAAIRAKSDLEFALNFLPANRAKTLAELGGGAKALVSAEKAALPAGYREGGSVGAAFNETGGLPEGYRRVINTKTGNTEVLAADGTFYLETSNGLKPKAGDNLAGLVEAEKNIASAKGTLNTSLLDELTANGVKFTPENVIATTRSSSGKVVFLETGNSKAGLQHIIEEHGSQFAQMGVSEAQIPGVVMRAVSEGKLVGYQGSGVGRPIYEFNINGQTQRIAVTVSDNGFVVGANPRGSVK